MSSRRSRSGGTRNGITFRRKNRSSRKAPLRISSSRFLLVAAMTRTSTVTEAMPPTGSTFCSCSARRTLAWVFRVMSPISSRNSVPPSASSNLPFLAVSAPVKAPRVWPNSSLSMSSSGMAAQLTSTNGPSARRLWWWMFRATSSLPVPFSPKISTRPLEGAAWAMSRAQGVDGRALAHHHPAVLDLLLEGAVLLLQPPLAQRVADDEEDLLEGERLLDEVLGADADRLAPRSRCCRGPRSPPPARRRRGRGGAASVSSPSIFGSQTSSRMRSKRRVSSSGEAGLAALHRLGGVPSSPRIPASESGRPPRRRRSESIRA